MKKNEINNLDKIKYIFCDLDGTLLRDDKKIAEKDVENLVYLCKKQKLKFAIASGRALSSILPLLKQYHLLTLTSYIVANNGVEIYDVDKNTMSQSKMVAHSQIQSILDTFKEIEFINVCFHNPNVFYAKRDNKRVSQIMKINNVNKRINPYENNNFIETPRVMLQFDEKDFDKVDSLVSTYQFDNLQGMYPDKGIYEYTSVEVAKDKAIASIVEQNQDSLESVMVFGDSFNDITMLRYCGLGIAMKNAEDEVKQNANSITTFNNNEGGVCDMLYQIYGEKQYEK